MSWRQQAMKDADGCDKPGEAAKQAVIPGFPNGATRSRESGTIRIPRSAERRVLRCESERSEVKHLSNSRKRKRKRLPQYRRANGEEPKPEVSSDASGVVGPSIKSDSKPT